MCDRSGSTWLEGSEKALDVEVVDDEGLSGSDLVRESEASRSLASARDVVGFGFDEQTCKVG
jgi:hypothetical protein